MLKLNPNDFKLYQKIVFKNLPYEKAFAVMLSAGGAVIIAVSNDQDSIVLNLSIKTTTSTNVLQKNNRYTSTNLFPLVQQT